MSIFYQWGRVYTENPHKFNIPMSALYVQSVERRHGNLVIHVTDKQPA